MKSFRRECVLQMAYWIFLDLCAFLASSHTTSEEVDMEVPIKFPSSLPSVSFWKAEWTADTLMPLSRCSHPTHIVSKTCPASSLLTVVLTKQLKEAVHCCVYFPSLRCGFLTMMLCLLWESSTSKTWSNLLHPEAIEQNRLMAAVT